MTFLEKNYHELCAIVIKHIREAAMDRKYHKARYIVLIVTHEDISYKHIKTSVIASKDNYAPYSPAIDLASCISIVSEDINESFDDFNYECLTNMVYYEIVGAINIACKKGLTTENGECTYTYRFNKPSIKGWVEHYIYALQSTNLKDFAPYFSFDQALENAEVRVTPDLYRKFGMFKKDSFYI